MMHEPRGVVFDLDGTLIDSGSDIAAAVNHALQSTGKKVLPEATIRRFVGDGARALCARAAGLPESDPAVDEVLELYLEHYLAHPTDHTKWMPHARHVLEELKGYKLAIATNKPRKTTDAVLERLGVRTLFAAIVGAGDAAAIKPAPAPILDIGRQLGIDTRELVVVGDGPQDVESGRRAGCRTIGVQGGFLAPERLVMAQPDVLLDSLAEVPAVLSRWSDSTMR